MKKGIWQIIAMLITIAALGIAIPNAYANSTPQLCEHGGSPPVGGECLNLWGGAGGTGLVKTFGPGVANDQVTVQPINGRCQTGSDLTTLNCPYNGVPSGLTIVQFVDVAGQCIGDNGGANGDAKAGGFDGCNNVNTGFGGGYGTVFFVEQSTCPVGWNIFINFHWQWGILNYGGSGNGQQWYLNNASGDCLIPSSF